MLRQLAACSLLLLFVVGVAGAQTDEVPKKPDDTKETKKLDAKEILAKTDAKIYAAKAKGLKDVAVEIDSPMFMGMKMKFYWLAGKEGGKQKDRSKVEIEGDAGQMPMLKNYSKKIARTFGAFYSGVVNQFTEDAKHTTATATEVDGKYIVKIKRNEKAPKSVKMENATLTISKDYKLLKMESVYQGQSIVMHPSFSEKDGKLVLSGQKMNQMGMDVQADIAWAKKGKDKPEDEIGKWWVPTSITQKMPMGGMEIKISFNNYKLNKGAAAKAYAPKKEEKPEDGEKKDTLKGDGEKKEGEHKEGEKKEDK